MAEVLGVQPNARWQQWRLGASEAPEFTLGAGLLLVVVLGSVVVPLVSPHGVAEFVGDPLMEPSWTHPFGTDVYGRDVFVRAFDAARVDLLIASVGAVVPFLIGTTIGVLAGSSRRGWVDTLVMRIVDSILAFPFVVLVLALVVVFGPTSTIGPLPAGLPALFAAFFLTSWSVYARLARGQTLSLRQREFVVAAGLLGYSRGRIIRRHLVPSVLPTTATYAISDAMLVVIAAASLPFLGAGVQAPTPEWGAMMFEGRSHLSTAPWITLGPGALLGLTGMGLSLLARAVERRRTRGARR